jgi:hypothetical protein
MTPQDINKWGTGLEVFGRMYDAFGTLTGGLDEKKAAEFQAAQLRQNAGQAMASAQRDLYSVQEQTALVASRALAVAAASGGGASDPTVVKIMAGIAGEGSYRAAVALYQGEEKARAMLNQARAVEYQGELSKQSAIRGAFGKFLGAGSAAIKGVARGQSLYERYGGDGGPGSATWGADLGKG